MCSRLNSTLFIVCSLIWLSSRSATVAAPQNAEFQTAKQAFLRDMRSPNPAVRIAAVRTFADVSSPGVAEWLLKRGLSDPDAEIRDATRIGMRKLVQDPTVAAALIEELKKTLRKTIVNEGPVELLRALAATRDETSQADLLKCLNDYLGAPKANLLVPMTAIDHDGLTGDADSLRSVGLLAKAKTFETHFGYRRCVVQALVQIRRPEAVEFLIRLIPETDGLVQYDVIHYLTRLTSQQFRDDHRAWSDWWEANRSTFEFPDSKTVLPDIPIDSKTPTYYRIPICAKRVVFVLDTSNSMRGLPIVEAKRALLAAVNSLHASVYFNVILFDSHVSRWSPRLVEATADTKQMASHVIEHRELGNATLSSFALKSAFDLDPEVIFFLSDGAPTDGAPLEIVRAVSQMNRTRRVSVHAIAVETRSGGADGLTRFMQPLAEQNYGTFQLIK